MHVAFLNCSSGDRDKGFVDNTRDGNSERSFRSFVDRVDVDVGRVCLWKRFCAFGNTRRKVENIFLFFFLNWFGLYLTFLNANEPMSSFNRIMLTSFLMKQIFFGKLRFV